MIAVLNRIINLIEGNITEEINLASLTGDLGTTEYHVRRMFSSLAGMPLSEYIRRRRMTVAAADVLADRDLLGTAVRYGYSSTEAFNRAFRSAEPVDVPATATATQEDRHHCDKRSPSAAQGSPTESNRNSRVRGWVSGQT